MKRFAISVAAVVILLLNAGTAAASNAKIETISMTFAPLTSATCANLPTGTSITWSGTGKSITGTQTSAGGITTITNTTHAHGVATDQAGNTYVFNYSNHYRISNSTAAPGTFSGMMVDSFSLAGHGPVRLHTGFLAGFTTDGASFGLDPLHSRGDPIDFTTGAAHCDPL